MPRCASIAARPDWLRVTSGPAGQTPADIINPMRQIVSKELEIDMGSVDPLSPQWSFMFGVGDTDTSAPVRLPTYSEVQERARRDSRWWDTAGGRQTDAGMTRTLLEAFGKVSY